ncbi:MAG TPA: M23 family metallopeptidase [Caldimonas sp.]|nr:M23 family metallopeptidase [Caldimonas sp.]HEX4234553.1 M23 family metallopeptidase [Caldimonas sp.]
MTASVSLALAGFAATAFGIAPQVPDAADLPQRTIVESVPTLDLRAQVDALAEQDLDLFRSEITRPSDTVDSLLGRLNVADAHAAAFLRSDPIARRLLEGRAGKRVQVRVDSHGTLLELLARYAAASADKLPSQFTRLRVQRIADKLVADLSTAPLSSQVLMAGGTIQSSLFNATDEAGIPDTVATQLAEIFANDIDFRHELKRGATFSVVYESLTADGEPISWGPANGRVLAAEFVNQGQTFSAMWFKDGDAKGAYFGLDGQSKQRSFLASPLEFSRVTSGFAMRMHPILNTWKQHNGVDYGAPTGTPVRTVGDGVVEFAGWQNGYGNVIHIQHGGERSTVYAHLSRIDVTTGQHVEQGMIIGAVGQTGWATGPHLHFEVKIDGLQQDPLKVAQTSEAATITPAAQARFGQLAQSVRAQLGIAESLPRTPLLGE